jgi:hypothetical protein
VLSCEISESSLAGVIKSAGDSVGVLERCARAVCSSGVLERCARAVYSSGVLTRALPMARPSFIMPMSIRARLAVT